MPITIKPLSALILALALSAPAAFAQVGDDDIGGGGADPDFIGNTGTIIINGLGITNYQDLYFGVIAPSMTEFGVVQVKRGSNNNSVCDANLVCLQNGTRARYKVIGTPRLYINISDPGSITVSDGSMEEVTEAIDDELFAKDFIRYSPRRIVLKPGERQTVRVSARLNGDMAEGEYRSHLRLQGAPLSAGRTLQSATSTDSGDLSIQLIAILSITIPVIMRLGQLDADVDIESINLQENDAEDETLLVARMTRTGSRSTYGDIKIYAPDQVEPVYFARGIALYTPNTERDLILPLPSELRAALTGKDIRIEYVSSDPQAPGVIANLTTRLP